MNVDGWINCSKSTDKLKLKLRSLYWIAEMIEDKVG